METLEYDHTVFNPQQQEADKALAVRFFRAPQKDEGKSSQEGRPIFVDTDMIEIRVRGDRNNIVIKPVTNEIKTRFRGAWEAYSKGQNSTLEGTPLAEWPSMSASMVEELKYLGFSTVEQLAQASDSVCGKVPGLTAMKQKAKVFMEFSKGAAPLEQLQARMTELESQREVDERTKGDLSKKLEELTAKYNKLLEQVATKK
jgi:hypothetical protein